MALVGDEHFHYLTTPEGVAMQLDRNSGFYVPLEADVLASGLKTASDRRQHANQRRAARLAANRAMYASAASPKDVGIRSSIVGKKRGLVILVNFSDQYLYSSVSDLDEMFNKKGYNKHNHIGSVKDYFYDQSYGKLEIDFDVVGPVFLPQPSTYYGKNESADLTDVNAGRMVIEACKAVDDKVDFADYDWDGDRSVEQVYIIYARYGENYGGNNPDFVWAHSSTVENVDGFRRLDGVTLGTYACNCEVQGWEENEGKPGYEEATKAIQARLK